MARKKMDYGDVLELEAKRREANMREFKSKWPFIWSAAQYCDGELLIETTAACKPIYAVGQKPDLAAGIRGGEYTLYYATMEGLEEYCRDVIKGKTTEGDLAQCIRDQSEFTEQRRHGV